ncbi:hypothetical protein PT974_10820 [Cladobotryum mycophilum]|uniref:Zn(2)-C6 fungal-type domain-containing protein n=1 Tax=Cladobotryum mycophilum TaxID=491253 RepID=A0ABR0SAW4_9HYPO
MPIPRQKSCAQCRKAKTKCSLTVPQCSRCIEKNIGCNYAGYSVRAAPYAASSPSTRRDASTELRALEREQGRVPSGSGFDPDIVFTGDMDVSSGWNLSDANITVGEPILTPNAPNPQLTSYQGLFSPMDTWPINLTNQEAEEVRQPVNYRRSVAEVSSLSGNKPSSGLAKRQALSAHTILATKTMLGQIAAQCALDDNKSYDCLAKGAHQCLPRTLSICASLVNMHQTKTEASSDFVWDTIYAEVGRLAKEYHNLGITQLLEAVQALSIYTLLQAFDQDSIEKNDIKSLLGDVWNIARKLHLAYDCRAVDTVENPFSRTEWVLYESIRRSMTLLSILEVFVEVVSGTCDRWCDSTFDSVPLPCIRDLWEVKSTYEWTRRYDAHVRSRNLNRTLRLKDFRYSQTLSPEQMMSDTGDVGGVVKDVMRWCEGVDQYGTLVWLAASLVKV